MKILVLFYFVVSVAWSSDGYDHHSFKKFRYPQRDQSVIVTDTGYFPEKIIVFKGEKVKFFVTSTTKHPNCFIVENHELFLAANKGRVSEGEVVFKNSGEYSFYCPGHQFKGRVIVLGEDLEKKQVKKVERNIASDKEEWVPRDY